MLVLMLFAAGRGRGYGGDALRCRAAGPWTTNPPRRVRVSVDGRPARTVTVSRQTIYRLVSLPQARQFHLGPAVDPGVGGFVFTFG